MFPRLHLIANNTRFLVLSENGVFPNLASYFMSAMLRRLSDDWQHEYGHPLLVVESFVDPTRFSGTMYEAANWSYVGDSKGYARSNGQYTDVQEQSKRLYVRALRRDACRILSQRGELPAQWQARQEVAIDADRSEMRSLYEELASIPDHRRAQGRKHSIATVLAVHILATLSNMRGPVAAAEYARSLDQEELQSIGAWYNRTTGCYEPPSKATINRVVMHADAQQVEATLQRYARPRVALADQDTERTALAADGKHIRGANRNGTMHFETATLVEHSTGVPVASLNYHDDGGEIAAVCALLEEVPIGGAVITIDALHTTLDTAAKIVEKHGADYLMTVKQNASETYEALLTMPVGTGHRALQ